MRVLHLANTPLSGAPYKLMQVQKIGGIDARLISHYNAYDGRGYMVYPTDILLQSNRPNKDKRLTPDFSTEEVHHLFDSADILHLHNYVDDQYVFRLFPALKRHLKSKLVVIQFHSPRVSLKNVEKDLRNKDVDRRFVVAQYQVRQFPEATPVPNAIPIYHSEYSPVCRNNVPPLLAYCPSNTTLRGWNNKGYPETIAALKRVNKNSNSVVITNTPYLECLKKKQTADITIDEVITGSYHLSTLEALSHGQLAICGLDRQCEEVLCSYTGSSKHPIVSTTPKNLARVLEEHLLDRDRLKNHQKESRIFMETYWNDKFINDHFQKAYNP